MSIRLLTASLVLLLVAMMCRGAPSHDRQKRGFRNSALSTARGFGKRESETGRLLQDMAMRMEEPNRQIPSNWFADHVARNPSLAKFFVDKIVDQNGDGIINQEEMLQAL